MLSYRLELIIEVPLNRGSIICHAIALSTEVLRSQPRPAQFALSRA